MPLTKMDTSPAVVVTANYLGPFLMESVMESVMKKVFSPATINRLKKEGISEKEIEEVSKQVADLALSLEDHLLTDHQIELEDDVELTLRPFIDSGLEQYVNWYAVLIALFQEKLAEVGWSQFRQMISDASTT